MENLGKYSYAINMGLDVKDYKVQYTTKFYWCILITMLSSGLRNL